MNRVTEKLKRFTGCKAMLLILIFFVANKLAAQKNAIEIARMFEKTGWPDIYLEDSEGAALKLEYYLENGILYKKTNDVLESIALADIDFSKEFVYENGLDIVSATKKSPYEMTITSVKPKKIPGLSFSFEFKEEAELAFKFLKKKEGNPSNELVLTPAFSSQLEQIICSAASNFDAVKGELCPSVNTFSKNYKSKVEPDGSLVTRISDEGVGIQYGDFETEAAAVKAYNLLREKINGTVFTCCKVNAMPFSEYKPDMKAALGLWNIYDIKGLENKNVMMQMILVNNIITLSVVVSSPDDDDDW